MRILNAILANLSANQDIVYMNFGKFVPSCAQQPIESTRQM